MKRLIAIVFLGLFLCGCGLPESAKREIKENALRCERFVELMDQDKTTREQEQKFIEANRKAWGAMAEKYGD